MRAEFGTLRQARPVITWEGIDEIRSSPDADFMALSPPRLVTPEEVKHLLACGLSMPIFTGRAVFPFVSNALATLAGNLAAHGLKEIVIPTEAHAPNLVLLGTLNSPPSPALPLLDRTHLISIQRRRLAIAEVVKTNPHDTGRPGNRLR
jgi:hypothetical protein